MLRLRQLSLRRAWQLSLGLVNGLSGPVLTYVRVPWNSFPQPPLPARHSLSHYLVSLSMQVVCPVIPERLASFLRPTTWSCQVLLRKAGHKAAGCLPRPPRQRRVGQGTEQLNTAGPSSPATVGVGIFPSALWRYHLHIVRFNFVNLQSCGAITTVWFNTISITPKIPCVHCSHSPCTAPAPGTHSSFFLDISYVWNLGDGVEGNYLILKVMFVGKHLEE